jgi:hypothetical protein
MPPPPPRGYPASYGAYPSGYPPAASESSYPTWG